MRTLAITFAVLFLFSPTAVFAACTGKGATVVYVNGVLTNFRDAQKDLFAFRDMFVAKTGRQDIKFINGYNPTHLAGVGDAAESASQVLGKPLSDFDFTVMLNQIYRELATRRVLLMGYSQGALYVNALYGYLLSHGEPKEAVGVYAVATPASTVAGGGAYLNSDGDLALSLVATAAKKAGVPPPLPANISIIPSATDLAHNAFVGHSFTDAYLAGASDIIISDVSRGAGALVPSMSSDTADCFDPPPHSVAYTLEQALFFVADPVAGVMSAGVSMAVGGTAPVCQ